MHKTELFAKNPSYAGAKLFNLLTQQYEDKGFIAIILFDCRGASKAIWISIYLTYIDLVPHSIE
ncbi:MAG: hypothetical protein ACJBCI_00305, partial [Candidatus Tisiphia sp.]